MEAKSARHNEALARSMIYQALALAPTVKDKTQP